MLLRNNLNLSRGNLKFCLQFSLSAITHILVNLYMYEAERQGEFSKMTIDDAVCKDKMFPVQNMVIKAGYQPLSRYQKVKASCKPYRCL